MLVNKNYKNATKEFQTYLNVCLRGVYNSNVQVKQNTIKYAMHDDADYNTIFEIMEFEMSDGKKFEIYFEPKGRKYFKQI